MPGNGNGNGNGSGKHWARLQADVNCKLRRGAWYRVRELGPLEAVVEVKGKALPVPCAFLKVVETPPRRWTIVPRPHDAVRYPASWGTRYAVCPSCGERAQLEGHPERIVCPRCRGDFAVAWDEPYNPAL